MKKVVKVLKKKVPGYDFITTEMPEYMKVRELDYYRQWHKILHKL